MSLLKANKNKIKLKKEASSIPVSSYYNGGEGCYGSAHLTEENPVSDWFSVTGGNGIAIFNCLSHLKDGSNAILSGSIKIQCILGQKEREYAICDVIKNTSDLSTAFFFTSAHLGKSGIECGIPKNCLLRLVLEANTGDNVIIEWVC